MRFLEVVFTLAISEFEHGRTKLTSRETRKINAWTRRYLSTKASRVVSRRVRLREEPMTQYVIPGGVRTLIALHHGLKTKKISHLHPVVVE